MSKPKNLHDIPDPHFTVAGSNLPNTTGSKLSLENQAKKFRPPGVLNEPPVATLARFANLLIDRETGEAYSADELLALANGNEIFMRTTAQGSPSNSAAATTAITVVNKASVGDKFIIGGEEWEFVDSLTTGKQILVGESPGDQSDKIVAALSGSELVTAAEGLPEEFVITSILTGAAGEYAITKIGDFVITGYTSPMPGGIDATAANQIGDYCRCGDSSPYSWYQWDGTNWIKNSTTSGIESLTNKTLISSLISGYRESKVVFGTVGASATIAISSGTVITATLTASTATTFTMPAQPAAGESTSFTLFLKQAASTGNGTATFTGVKWGSSGAPTITATAGKMDILTFTSDGTNWYGSISQGFTP